MATSPFEVPRPATLELPEGYRGLDLFTADQATIVGEQQKANIDKLKVSGLNAKGWIERMGQDPMTDGHWMTEGWWLARLYIPESQQFDQKISALSHGVVKDGIKKVNKVLEDPASGYYVVVDSLTNPETKAVTHSLARLMELGMTEKGEVFSVLEQADGQPGGYRAVAPVERRAYGALYH